MTVATVAAVVADTTATTVPARYKNAHFAVPDAMRLPLIYAPEAMLYFPTRAQVGGRHAGDRREEERRGEGG